MLLAVGEGALEVFRTADNAIDRGFVADLEQIVERARRELEAFSANPS